MIPLLWLMLALTCFTAVQRFVMVWRQANETGHGPPPADRRVFIRRAGFDRDTRAFTSPAVAARWRAWREANGWVPRAERYADGSRRRGATASWHERRQARLARLREQSGNEPGAGPSGRRAGSRRP